MTFIRAKKTESFFYPINLPIINDRGVSQTQNFDFRFKRVSRSKLHAMQKAQEAAADLNADSLERDVDYVFEIADGWRGYNDPDGTPIEFNRATVTELLDEEPGAAGEIVRAFFEATLRGGRKEKNS